MAFGRRSVQPAVQAVIGDPMPVLEGPAGDRCLLGTEGVQVHEESELEPELATFVSGQELGTALNEALTGVDRRIGDGGIADHGVDGPQCDRLVEPGLSREVVAQRRRIDSGLGGDGTHAETGLSGVRSLGQTNGRGDDVPSFRQLPFFLIDSGGFSQ